MPTMSMSAFGGKADIPYPRPKADFEPVRGLSAKSCGGIRTHGAENTTAFEFYDSHVGLRSRSS